MTSNTTDPSPPTPPTVAQALLHYLALEGVTHVFGIPGGGLANLLVEFKNQRTQIQYVICRHEGGAAYMADGYARMTGKPGVVMATSGPGATNCLTGVMNAQNGGSPLMVITGEVAEQFFGRGYLQEGIDASLDIDVVFKGATAYTTVITAGSNFETLMRQALRTAMMLPRKAVHISLPNDVAAQPVTATTLPASPSIYRAGPGTVAQEEVREAMAAILACKRPLIFLGNGTRAALSDPQTRQAFISFVEQYAIPVMTTSDGKGVFPEDHPLSLRVYGVADCIWPYYWLNGTEPAYDGLLVIGSSLGELSTNTWHPMLVPQGPFIQVDVDQGMIARSFPVTHGIVGEAASFIRTLARLSPEFPPSAPEVSDRTAALQAIKQAHSPFADPAAYAGDSSPVTPPSMMRVCNERLPQDCVFLVDAGNCVGWGVHYFIAGGQRQFISALSMGPMGFAVAAVVGTRLGAPERVCVTLTGDGAFMMHGAEVSTARQMKCGAIWIVLNDNDLTMVSQGQSHFFPNPADPPGIWSELFEIGAPDLVLFAQGLGAQAVAVNTTTEFAAALDAALAGAAAGIPQVIVAHIDRSQFPPYYNPLYGPPPHHRHSPSSRTMSTDNILDVAIVGGGISGIYTGWRLLTTNAGTSAKLEAWRGSKSSLSVGVFEGSNRIGGRLLSVRSAAMPDTVCELGGMRYVSSQKLVRSLVENKLNLPRHEQVVDVPENLAFLRNKQFRMKDLTDPGVLPYNFSPAEAEQLAQGTMPPGLIGWAVTQLLPEVAKLNGDALRAYLSTATIDGTPLHCHGFWNLLMRTLTSEGRSIALSTVGYDSLGMNANAADLIAEYFDFTPNVKYSLLDKGYENLPWTLQQQFEQAGGTVKTGAWLQSFERVRLPDGTDGVELHFQHGRAPVRARSIVLAMPRRSLELLAQTGPVLDPSVAPHVRYLARSVDALPLYKMFLVYDKPWWEPLGVTAGRSLTDMPVHQCYYWQTNKDAASALMVYNDMASSEYWSGLRLDPMGSGEAEQWTAPGGLTSSRFHSPHKPFRRKVGAPAPGPAMDPVTQRELANWDAHVAPAEMVKEMHRQLCIMHNVPDAPPPVDAAYMAWADDPYGGAVHFWNPGYKSTEVMTAMTQPVDGFPCYICGEAYSTNQTWAEGALQTAEIVLQQRLGMAPPDWLTDE